MTPDQVMGYTAARFLIVLAIGALAYGLAWSMDRWRNSYLNKQPRLGKPTQRRYLSFRNIAFVATFLLMLTAYRLADSSPASMKPAELDRNSLEAKLAYATAIDAVVGHIKATKSIKTPRLFDHCTIDKATITTDGTHYMVNGTVGGETGDEAKPVFWFRYECILARDKAEKLSSLGVVIKDGYIR